MQVKLIEVDIYYTDRVVVGDMVVEILGLQDDLLSAFAFDKSLHVPECVATV
ncbi:hypothetical protein GCM10011400_22850 [Paraburkholderia caffeinilytica]|uniref:Uncharacterized protein n=1 Tax=Paraburkholderia caffeinilytica TaxID=1761016 RepID=A0ABQ1M6S5_9BURK|nr:hypothetical protein GCM10011400_22850 [Paraburkholderia caffeinilytica]